MEIISTKRPDIKIEYCTEWNREGLFYEQGDIYFIKKEKILESLMQSSSTNIFIRTWLKDQLWFDSNDCHESTENLNQSKRYLMIFYLVGIIIVLSYISYNNLE